MLAVSNLLVSLTYLLHTLVAHMFLGVAPSSATMPHGEWAGREKLGGFLVFKLLLVSAVVSLNSFDLLILLSWYTCLSFLRSLASLASGTTSHTVQSGQPPRAGVGHLLVLVLLCNIVAAFVCVALFHQAGWGVVVLLTCDCALLGTDVSCHLLRHASQVMDNRHTNAVAELETEQLRLHNQINNNNNNNRSSSGQETDGTDNDNQEPHSAAPDEADRTPMWDEPEEVRSVSWFGRRRQDRAVPQNRHDRLRAGDSNESLTDQEMQEMLRELDRRMEKMETVHTNRLATMETMVFFLELVGYGLNVGHFLHIWTLHGLQFKLIDGILLMHLHSVISSAVKKVRHRHHPVGLCRQLPKRILDFTLHSRTHLCIYGHS